MLQINTTDELLPYYAEAALYRQEAYIIHDREERRKESSLNWILTGWRNLDRQDKPRRNSLLDWTGMD